jgi:hypothetical protein
MLRWIANLPNMSQIKGQNNAREPWQEPRRMKEHLDIAPE